MTQLACESPERMIVLLILLSARLTSQGRRSGGDALADNALALSTVALPVVKVKVCGYLATASPNAAAPVEPFVAVV